VIPVHDHTVHGTVPPKQLFRTYLTIKHITDLKATRALAAEWAKANIRFNSIAPSTAETGMYFIPSGQKLMSRIGPNLDVAGLDDSPENRLRLADLIPLGRLCKVSDVANMACFLASDEASYITGAQVPVDGGRAI
jgi:3-oxoacyl-[acyl-carrier protein] reductase